MDNEEAAAKAAPAKERKGGKGAVIGMIFFALVAVGLGVWVAILLINGNKKSGDNASSGDKNCDSTVISNDDIKDSVDYDKKIREITDALAGEAEKLVPDRWTVSKVYDANVRVDYNDNVSVLSSRSYGIRVWAGINGSDFLKVSQEKIAAAFDPVLSKYGLKKIAGEFAFNRSYFKSDDGIFCQYDGAGSPSYAGCAYSGWVNKNDGDLVAALYTAYNKKEKAEHLEIYVDASSVATSKSGNYETVEASTEEMGMTFYRKKGDSEWTFFMSGQQGPRCEDFNTDELKEAYEGKKCYDSKGNDNTVKR